MNQTMYNRTDLSTATTGMFSHGSTYCVGMYLWGEHCKMDKLISVRACKEKNQMLNMFLALYFLHSTVKI